MFWKMDVCSAGNKCTKSITTDKDGLSITKECGRHTCNVETSDQKTMCPCEKTVGGIFPENL